MERPERRVRPLTYIALIAAVGLLAVGLWFFFSHHSGSPSHTEVSFPSTTQGVGLTERPQSLPAGHNEEEGGARESALSDREEGSDPGTPVRPDGVADPAEDGSLYVRVVDDEGDPHSDVEVTLHLADETMRRAMTDFYGRAVFDGLPDSEVTVQVHPDPGFSVHYGEPVNPKGQEIEIQIRRLGWVRGTVLAPNGKPFPHINLRVSLAAFRTDSDRTSFTRLQQMTAIRIRGDFERRDFRRERMWVVFSTNADGDYAFSCALGTKVDLWVDGMDRDGEPSESSTPVSLRYRAELQDISAPAEDLVIQTERIEMNRTLSVLVRGPRGRPLAHAEVHASSAEGYAMFNQTTGMDGRASFKDLPAEGMHITASATPDSGLPEGAISPRWPVVVPNGQEVVLAFKPGVLLEGVVVGPGGSPIAYADVWALLREDLVASAHTDGNGRFRVEVPPGKDYSLKARIERTVSLDPYIVSVLAGRVDRINEFDDPVTIRLAKIE